MAMTPKVKKTTHVTDPQLAKLYKEQGTKVTASGTLEVGFRFDHVHAQEMQQPDGRIFCNVLTYSPESSEVLTLLKSNGKWYMVMGLQARSPYLVNVDGELYCKFFLEQAAGCVKEDQTFLDAAVAEGCEELGSHVTGLYPLSAPILYRHVSYTDEMSRLYLAITEDLGQQNLDNEENIHVQKFPLADARTTFLNYINGNVDTFFGFDIPEVTALSMALFFWKLDLGQIDLDNLSGNLLENK